MVLCIIPPNFRLIAEILSKSGYVVPQTWSKPIMEISKVPWNAQKLAKHGHFE